MRLPSLDTLTREAGRAARRFPLVLAAALTAAAAALVWADVPAEHEVWGRLVATAVLAIPGLLALALTAERRGWSHAPRRGLQAVLLLGLVLFFARWPGWSETIRATRWLQLAVAFHLAVAWLPWAGAPDRPAGAEDLPPELGLWQHNRFLLLRFLIAALFALVLYLGLSLALLSIDRLFGVEFEEAYLRLGILAALVFHPWFFLGGVPKLRHLERETEYPTILKVFSQYILIPIVAVYLVILTAYLAKVLVTRQWPSGWIGWLVSGVSTAGILALLLVHPVRWRPENRWVRLYARGLWIGLLPAIGMLWAAIWQRVDQYGITERRYFLAVLAVWLGAVAVWFLWRRRARIRAIPAGLCAIALLTFAGPWSAYSVSRRSQVERLQGLLERNGLLEDGRLARPQVAAGVPFEDRREISAVLRYLLETHGTESIAPWFERPLAEVDTLGGASPADVRARLDDRARLLTEAMGVAYVGRWAGRIDRGRPLRIWSAGPTEALPVEGWTWYLRTTRWPEDTALVAGDTATARWLPGAGRVRLELSSGPAVSVPLLELFERLQAAGYGDADRGGEPVPDSLLAVEVRGPGLAARFRLVHATAVVEGGEWTVHSLQADWLLRPVAGGEAVSADTAGAAPAGSPPDR